MLTLTQADSLVVVPSPDRRARPVGQPTRGTTGANRLRRIDRWLVSGDMARTLRRADDPLVVDLGFGASAVTTVELSRRLRRIRPDVHVLGLEIDPDRVRTARAMLDRLGGDERIDFALGGFELGPVAGRRPILVRAANVWRQYPVEEVAAGWAMVCRALHPQGVLVDATCDEVGRLASWLALPAVGTTQAAASVPTAIRGGTPTGTVAEPEPVSLTLSMRLAGLDAPGTVAQRLPKVLIHRNVPGERVHALLTALDTAWTHAAALATFGARQRFSRAVETIREDGWPILNSPARWRLGEVSVPWSAVR